MRKAFVGITLFLLASPLLANEELDDRMMHAASILQEIRGPLAEDAPGVLENAHAVAVFPKFVQVGLVGGVKHGGGVLATRLASGAWSRPAFVKITSGSVGLQLGVSVSQLLIVFKDPKAVEAISGGQFAIGADAGYAAGQVGGSAAAGTDNKLQNRIVAMARSKGLFAGVSLEGGVLRIEKDTNVEFYNDAIGLDGRKLLENTQVELPPVAQHFLIVLGESVPPLSEDTTLAGGEEETDANMRFAEDENADFGGADYTAQAGTGADAQANAGAQPGMNAQPRAAQRMASANSAPQNTASVNGPATPGRSTSESWIAPDGRELPSRNANATPQAASWVTPENAYNERNYPSSSGPGLGSRIVGKLTDAAVDAAKDLAVDRFRRKPEAQAAKVAAKVGGELAKSAASGLTGSGRSAAVSAAPPTSATPRPAAPSGSSLSARAQRPMLEPMGAVASTEGAWLDPAGADYTVAGRSPGARASVSRSPITQRTGPPPPSEWPQAWRDAQILGGVCEPGT